MKTLSWLGNHYEFGMILSIGTGAMGFMESLMPLFRFIAVIIGIAIGLVTLYIKIHQAKKLKK